MKHGRMLKSAGIVGSFTLLSRFLGLGRDILMAGFFGTSLPMSAFVVAFTIPNLFRRLFGEGALSAAFVPVFIEAREKDGEPAAWKLAQIILTLLATFLTLVTLISLLGMSGYLLRPDVGEKTAMTLRLLRIMLPYMIFICMAAITMGILNAYHKFAIPAFAPSLLNLLWILAVLLVCPLLGDTPEQQIFGVAWAVLLAGALQWLVQLPTLRSLGYQPGWSFDIDDPKVHRVFRLMGPASLGMAITQINTLIDRLMAVWIGVWAPAALFFSERLIYFPQGIFATALSTVLLPVFSRQAARQDHQEIKRTIQMALRNLLYVMIPASIGLLILARPIVQMIFEWKTFDDTSTEFTAVALMFYAPGLLVFSLSKVLVPAFYALQDTRTPVKVALLSVLLKIALSLIFMLTWPLHLKHAGLALATVLGETFNGLMLAWLIHRRLGSPGWSPVMWSAGKALFAATLMAFTAIASYQWASTWTLPMPTKASQVVAVLFAIGLAILSYGVTTWLLRSPEISSVATALKSRWGRRN
jgi:putative peptidoglycan lipid II flippase